MAPRVPILCSARPGRRNRYIVNAMNKDIPSRPILFHRQPKIQQMRDPLSSDWNLALDKDLDPSELASLIDFSKMNGFFRNFLNVVGLPVAIIDLNARVLASSNWQRICMEFHRVNPDTLVRCIESDVSLSQEMAAGKPYAIYRCHNGLTDCAAPIVIEGHHIANLFIGQFFLSPPDMDFFRRQQEEFKFSRESYFAALAEVPIVSEEKLPSILELLTGLAHQIAQQSLAEKRALAAFNEVEHLVVERTKELQESHELLSKLTASAPGMVYQYQLLPDGSFRFPYVSLAVNEIFELSEEMAMQDADLVFSRIHPDDLAGLMKSIEVSAMSLTPWSHEFRVNLPHKGLRWLFGNSMPERHDDGSIVWHGYITDVTQLKEADERIRHLAQYDVLTDIPNRELFGDRLHQALMHARRSHEKLAVLFLDMDNFKPINDTYGHAVGDKLLQFTAKQMQGLLRSSDTVARIGGDEFVILLNTITSEQDALFVAVKLKTLLNREIELEGIPMSVSISIGIAIYPEHGSSGQELIKNADTAMYAAKKIGNSVKVYLPAHAGSQQP